MEEALKDFFLYLTAEKGLSLNTIDAYQNDLAKVLRVFGFGRTLRFQPDDTGTHCRFFGIAQVT